jgi:hypothetical protein
MSFIADKKEFPMKRLFIITFSLCLFTAATCNASWLAFHKPEFKGKIVDIETKEPIEGVVVVAIYSKLQMAIGDSVVMNIHAQEALTNKKGEFIIPSYSTVINPLSSSYPVYFHIFKPGYASLGPATLEDVFFNSDNRPDRDILVPWNQDLKYRILKAGVVMLPRVTGKDRIDSFYNIGSDISSFRKTLPIANKMMVAEATIVIGLEKNVLSDLLQTKRSFP